MKLEITFRFICFLISEEISSTSIFLIFGVCFLTSPSTPFFLLSRCAQMAVEMNSHIVTFHLWLLSSWLFIRTCITPHTTHTHEHEQYQFFLIPTFVSRWQATAMKMNTKKKFIERSENSSFFLNLRKRWTEKIFLHSTTKKAETHSRECCISFDAGKEEMRNVCVRRGARKNEQQHPIKWQWEKYSTTSTYTHDTRHTDKRKYIYSHIRFDECEFEVLRCVGMTM